MFGRATMTLSKAFLKWMLAGEPRTQSIVVKQKREHECFAVANLEAPVLARAAANKTIVVGVRQRQNTVERVALTVTLPKATNDTNSECAEIDEDSERGDDQTSELVEQQLREIGRHAENLAQTINQSLPRENRESDIMSTSASSSFIRLDKLDEETNTSNTEATPLHKSSSTSRVSGDGAVEVRLTPVRRVFPTIGVERGRVVDRLSKGLADLTAGSQDRLQRWKHKLQTTARRHKDVSEPPPMHRHPFSSEKVSAGSDDMRWKGESASPQGSQRPRPLHSSKSLQNTGSMGHVPSLHAQLSLDMEHRTLKSRENNVAHRDMFSEHYASNSLCSAKLDGAAQPARLPPISGLRPDGDLVRPVAFRPVPAHSVGFAKRQSNSAFNNEFRPVNSLISMPAVPSAAVPTGPNIMKPKGMYQPSTSFCPLPQHPTVRNVVENEYDTVTDFYEKEKHSDVGSNGSDYSGFHGSTGLSKSIGHDRSVGSPGNTNKKSFTSSTSSSASRQSSGVHVTPSPSDSGIVDYESIIRDKENELREVRSTMEQNEEIIIKVYQEKERNYKEDVANLRARLTASEKGENALRTQLASCQRQTESMRTTIDELRAEKSELSRRCSQLEREVASLRQQQCTECVRHRAGVANGSRLVKESTPSDELREEVGQLRREVATLRDALSNVALLSSTLANGTPPGVTRTPSEPKISARDRLI